MHFYSSMSITDNVCNVDGEKNGIRKFSYSIGCLFLLRKKNGDLCMSDHCSKRVRETWVVCITV